MSRISSLFEVRKFPQAIVYQKCGGPGEHAFGNAGGAGSEDVSPQILVVDDATVVRLYYRQILEREGYRVEEAINGMRLEKALQIPFDLCIVDVTCR